MVNRELESIYHNGAKSDKIRHPSLFRRHFISRPYAVVSLPGFFGPGEFCAAGFVLILWAISLLAHMRFFGCPFFPKFAAI